MATALLNGQLVEPDWLQERGFQFGDGLFETIAVFDGKACLLDRHFKRLLLGCQRLALPQPDIAVLESQINRLIHEQQKGVVKLYWTAGPSQRGYVRPKALVPTSAIVFTPWPEWPGLDADNISVKTAKLRLGIQPALAGIKHLNRLEQVLARKEIQGTAYAECLMYDVNEYLIEGSMSNIFIQSGEKLLTPKLHSSGISGVIRDLAFELADKLAIPLKATQLSKADVEAADALYLTNSVIGVWRVGKLDETELDLSVPIHPLVPELRRAAYGI